MEEARNEYGIIVGILTRRKLLKKGSENNANEMDVR
jgi:hypothetical protein